MSLNSIQLTPYLLADLYAASIVDLAKEDQSVAKEIRFLGSNRRNLLIAVRSKEAAFLTEDTLQFLTTILSACSLSLEDAAIINWEKNHLEGNEITDTLKIRTALLFGIEPLTYGLPMNFPVFQAQVFKQTTYLHMPGLETIKNQPHLKKELWSSLKLLFHL
ncbi:MAG: hypothetical protein WKF70_09425 [Chitinophagaceae bacterium]